MIWRDNVRQSIAYAALATALLSVRPLSSSAADPAPAAKPSPVRRDAKAYGEWRIQVKPDKMQAYANLIESQGLPLFREAGGKMVGWWTTLVGNLYEHVTIWEYDDLGAFEQAAEKLGKDPRFAQFVSERDPLLAGEQNRFLHLTDFSAAPQLPEQSKVVEHEIHRALFGRREAYLKYMQAEGLPLLKRHGFKVVGPWIVGVGASHEVTYLFCYDSLQDREKLVAAFAAHPDARAYSDKVNNMVTGVTTHILLPAAFAHAEPVSP